MARELIHRQDDPCLTTISVAARKTLYYLWLVFTIGSIVVY
jgi:hypothetical protein